MVDCESVARKVELKDGPVKSILACFAHPDDELGVGPLVGRAVTEGAHATLICATNGDVGTVDEKYLRGYDSIAALRLAELACATQAIGFSEVVTFGYRDSGMMGSADNDTPGSLWQAPLDEVTERVEEVMRRTRPQVVITFNTYGAYGHPDHIKIHQATVAAFQRLQAEPDGPRALYYTTGPRRLARTAVTVLRLLGRDPRHLGRNKDVDIVAAVEAMTPITTRVSVSGYRAGTEKALRCHASQISFPPLLDLPRRLLAPLIQRQMTLSRVYPAPRHGEPTERDIFQR
jgi:LmbE family N-acetylglucosaminyl deacetylase